MTKTELETHEATRSFAMTKTELETHIQNLNLNLEACRDEIDRLGRLHTEAIEHLERAHGNNVRLRSQLITAALVIENLGKLHREARGVSIEGDEP